MSDNGDLPEIHEDPSGSKRAPQPIVHAEKKRQAVELRMRGYSYFQIGKALDTSKGYAYRLVSAAIKDIPREVADEYRRIELEHLLDLRRHNYPDPDDVAGYRSSARLDALFKIHDRIVRLLGLEGAQKIHISGAVDSPTIVSVVEAAQDEKTLDLLLELDERVGTRASSSKAEPGTLRSSGNGGSIQDP